MTQAQKKERLTVFYRNYDMISAVKTPFCINCKYFVRHYIHAKDAPGVFTCEYVALDYGHCTYKNVKDRKAWDVCEHFERRGR